MYIIYSLNNGGAETLAIRLAEKLDKNIFNTMVCSLSDVGPLRDMIIQKKIQFFTLGKVEGKDFTIIRKLKRLINEQNVDIIHTHNQGPLLYTYLSTFFEKKPRIVHTEHINMGKEFSYSRRHVLYNNLIYRCLDGFLSIAQHLTDDFRKKYRLSHAQIVTIHNGIEIFPEKKVMSNSLREELRLGSDVPIVGNISALRPQKDHATLINAMNIVVRRFPGVKLAIAGEGELDSDLKKQVKRLNLEDSVIFLGYRSDIREILPQFNLFVLPSLYEGLPLCILEAMEAGKPIVATDVEGTNELIIPQKTGLLTPAGNPEQMAEAIISILSNPMLAEKMGKAARKLVEREYSMGFMIKKYQKYYQDIFNHRS